MPRAYVITGATSGIGLAAAEQLCQAGALVLGVGRSQARCDAAKNRISRYHSPAQVHYLVADLSLQSQVRQLAHRIGEELSARGISGLDGLVNDAAAFTWRRQETAEGFETQWAVNHLAPFRLTHELLPLLGRSPTARVVTVSSGSHYGARLRWDDLQLHHGYNGYRAYRQTKLCNVYFTAELRRRLGPGSPVRAFAADPGLVHTDLGAKETPAVARWFWRWWSKRGRTPEDSARGIVFLATEPSIADRPEVYWKHSHPVPPNPVALNPEEGRRLWDISMKMCNP